ncbi:MAG: putative secondary metabolism biosynthetic enzyme [Bathelium mastoideum]|nr:MAG: putative secondary metabolism biosynthetic enzyme [Bathelium mastoideum]
MKHMADELSQNLLSDWTPTTSSVVKDEGLVHQVQNVLLESGFTFGTGYSASSGDPKIIAQLKKAPKNQKKITLIVPHHHHPLVNAVQMSFQKSGIRCDRRTIEGDLPPGQDIISIVDFDTPYLYNIAEDKFRDFANRLSNFKSSMVWVTPAAQISCKHPNSAMILGLTRTLRAELRKDITVVEIDDEATTYLSSSKSLLKIYQGLSQRLRLKDIDPDYEYAIVDGDIKIPRLHWTSGKEELAKCVSNFAKHGSDPHNPRATNGSPRAPTAFRSNASYLLVGGLGGLGRVVAAWMVENGARNILFLSRSAKEDPETTPFFDELRARGCTVSTFSGSVTSQSDVESAVKRLTMPLAGVMQMSAVTRDNWMSQMTFAEWNQCVQPKVQGTWNLHQATIPTQLDFFVLFSSICGMVGQWGQANYNSANSFLDAFVNYRHGQGLSASVVDIGFMGGVGMAMENDALVEKLKASGYLYLDEQDLLAALTVAIAHSRPGQDQFMKKSQLCLGLRSTKPITDPSTRVAWKKDARMAFSHGLGSLS